MVRSAVVVQLVCLSIFAGLAGSCQSAPAGDDASATQGGEIGENGDRTDAGPRDRPLAYVRGEPIRRDEIFQPLLEAAGGRILSELVLDRLIRDQLDRQGMTLTNADLARERERVLATLDPENENQAARLLRELRRRRGLGDQRFQALLRRNAGLRKLVEDEVSLSDAAVRQEYRRQFGTRYRIRLLVVGSFDRASELRNRIEAGEATFSDLAARHSTDASADRGGLLSPISPVDPSYPSSIREALSRLADRPAGLSEVIALNGQFALLKLEEKIEAQAVEFADVKERLATDLRRRLERRRMQQLARQMLSDADVTVLDPALGDSWRQQRDVLLSP